MSFSAEDVRHMRECLRLAARSRGRTSPNPMVGTVIVRDGRVLATGYHHRVGMAHAEVDALQKLDGRAAGATLYVNIEPCDHRGRTGPCTEAIRRSGVARVVVGMIDPNPLVNGRGLRRLRRAGIEVQSGLLEAQCRRLNEGFVSMMERGRPFVTLKLAATADGCIATRSGESRWVTGEPARARVHRMRAAVDAVLIGGRTARRDDPLLNVRLARGRDPLRVVVDSRAALPVRSRMLREGGAEVIVAVGRAASSRRVTALERAGATVWRLPARDNRVDLGRLLAQLGRHGVNQVLCEGGARLAGGLLAARLVDKLTLFYAPKILGGGIPMFAGGSDLDLASAPRLSDWRWSRVGDDQLCEAYLEQPE